MIQWKKYLRILVPAIALQIQHSAYGQAELAPWGNITGVRIEGQLFPFETRLVLAQNGNTKLMTNSLVLTLHKKCLNGAKE